MPSDFRKALSATPSVQVLWKDLTPIARRDFIRWIVSAKQVKTRKRRIEVACSKLASGMRRPCCYEVVPMQLYKALGASPKAKATWSELSPDERRDIVDYLDAAESKEAKKTRVEKVCSKLAEGKNNF